jgi:hypothetical protein
MSLIPTALDFEKLSRVLVDQGKLIEAGWIGLRAVWLHPEASQNQIDEMRQAFFAGAQHLFSSIMTVLEPDAEPTEKDLERMSLIQSELDTFIADFNMHQLPTRGNA